MIMEITEGRHRGEFLYSEANGTLSLDTVIVGGGKLAAGTVMGQITATEKFVQLAPAAEDGSQNAAGILYDNVDATGGDVESVLVCRYAEVNGSEITWPEGVLDADKAAAITQLGTLGIIVR
jgi:hypothetical protein